MYLATIYTMEKQTKDNSWRSSLIKIYMEAN